MLYLRTANHTLLPWGSEITVCEEHETVWLWICMSRRHFSGRQIFLKFESFIGICLTLTLLEGTMELCFMAITSQISYVFNTQRRSENQICFCYCTNQFTLSVFWSAAGCLWKISIHVSMWDSMRYTVEVKYPLIFITAHYDIQSCSRIQFG